MVPVLLIPRCCARRRHLRGLGPRHHDPEVTEIILDVGLAGSVLCLWMEVGKGLLDRVRNVISGQSLAVPDRGKALPGGVAGHLVGFSMAFCPWLQGAFEFVSRGTLAEKTKGHRFIVLVVAGDAKT